MFFVFVDNQIRLQQNKTQINKQKDAELHDCDIIETNNWGETLIFES